jgi:hypothetical protein
MRLVPTLSLRLLGVEDATVFPPNNSPDSVKSPKIFRSMGQCHTLHGILAKIMGTDPKFLSFLVISPTINLFADFSHRLSLKQTPRIGQKLIMGKGGAA